MLDRSPRRQTCHDMSVKKRATGLKFNGWKVKVAISALSSKLMSVGAFLIAFEGRQESIGIVYLESKGYEMKKVATLDDTLKNSELVTMWIFGDCYRH